ncbi:hypothetical protein Q4493_02460 [Colwellia sp. 1_MG-2023]|uniref:hypothetical protein n=1 Tax=Colwellia sp. 1_MG-2023 TaxID=3062649 RepID=UPI0026E38662|nr:hypothetical protein [Colwellia sp. 1_MG-2023]MDO6444630.1 hypothetical protein [Colwellia sp. 1_MG-2023]
MLKGYYQTILLSLAVHIVIFYLISLTTAVPSLTRDTTPQAIKSFLYVPPKQENTSAHEQVDSRTQEAPQTDIEPITIPQERPKSVIAETSSELEIVEQPTKNPEKTTTKNIDNPVVNQPPRNFSAFSQLNNLQKNLNNKIIEQESYRYSQKKSASILDGSPNLVPHSTKQLTTDEIKKKTSQQISSDIQITKGDDGRCTIERDLTAVGIEGVKSVEGFNCGKSKFDKNFQEHMKKVLKKLGK